MTAKIIDGKIIAGIIRRELAVDVEMLKKSGVTPGLGVLLVGDNPASRSYVTAKEKACKEIGIFSKEIHLPSSATHAQILDAVTSYNNDSKIHGILVQLPLPDLSIQQAVLMAVDPRKDVDGFHPLNLGKLMLGQPCFTPCTPAGIVELLLRSDIQIEGAHVVIVGRSSIVGRPLAHLLSQKGKGANATVTLCHTLTRDLGHFTRQADIVVAATGIPHTVTADMVNSHAVVVDVGVNRVDGKLVGDVDFEKVSKKVAAITPVPGGVGPMTITMLLRNTIQAAQEQQRG